MRSPKVTALLLVGAFSLAASSLAYCEKEPHSLDVRIEDPSKLCGDAGEASMFLMNEKIDLLERYRVMLEAWGCMDATSKTMLSGLYAPFLARLGDYERAAEVYGYKGRFADELRGAATIEALPRIMHGTRGKRAVFFNESHGNSETRAFFFSVLEPMRNAGFNYLALEALTMQGHTESQESAGSESVDPCGTVASDKELVARGYPREFTTGMYVNDPVYGMVVRRAIQLGFHIVGYETPNEKNPDERERIQAKKLSCILQRDKSAKLLVLAGFGHITKGRVPKDSFARGKMMAEYFREYSGLIPLSVDTVSYIGTPPAASPAERTSAKSAQIFLKDGVVASAPGVDLSVYIPVGMNPASGRPTWLDLGGVRIGREISCGGIVPCMVVARGSGESSDAVPFDRCIAIPPRQSCTIFIPNDLRQARYEIAVSHLQPDGS